VGLRYRLLLYPFEGQLDWRWRISLVLSLENQAFSKTFEFVNRHIIPMLFDDLYFQLPTLLLSTIGHELHYSPPPNFSIFFARIAVNKHIWFIRQIGRKLGMGVQENDNTFTFPINSSIISARAMPFAILMIETAARGNRSDCRRTSTGDILNYNDAHRKILEISDSSCLESTPPILLHFCNYLIPKIVFQRKTYLCHCDVLRIFECSQPLCVVYRISYQWHQYSAQYCEY
jgi:hypothetical protein